MWKNSRYLSGKLAVSYCGQGLPFLFAHGFPFDHTMWTAAAERLSDDFRVILPDLRGFGKSALDAFSSNGTTEMADFADDLAALLDEMGIERTVFCGLSMGGYIAMAFAEKYPQKFAGLILCDTKTAADTQEAAAGRRKLAETVFETGTEPLLNGIPNLISEYTLENKPEKVAFLREMILRQPVDGIAAAALGMANRPDTTENLAKIPLPTLVIGGEDDRLSPPASMGKIAEFLPNGTHFAVENAGHLLPLERPDAFAMAVVEWAKKNF